MFFKSKELRKMMMKSGDCSYRAIFFDLDGTLADSLSTMRVVYGKFMKKFSLADSDEEFDSINGSPLAEIIKILRRKHSINYDEGFLVQTYISLIKESYSDVKPMSGAVELLTCAKEEHNFIQNI